MGVEMHSLELLWADVSEITTINAAAIIRALVLGEEAYQDLLEAKGAATAAVWARQLFGLKKIGPTKLNIDATGKTITDAYGNGSFSGISAGATMALSAFTNAGNNAAFLVTSVTDSNTLVFGDSTTLVTETGGGDEVAEEEAAQAQTDKVTDLINAQKAIHELYQAMTNVAVTQKDRASDLRRMA